MTALPDDGIKCPCPWVARGICDPHTHFRNTPRSPWTCLMHDHGGENHPLIADQPPSIPNDSVPVWNLVIADMQDRDRVGRERYGTPLQTFNGRDQLVDAYQEGLDFVVYIRAAIEERRAIKEATPPFRLMGDGSPCWCISSEEIHEGWVHSPVCKALWALLR